MENVDTHEEMAVKTLLNSRTMGLFINRRFAEEQGFKIEKLEKPIQVQNIDGSNNVGRQ